jgi:dCMP deaminase
MFSETTNKHILAYVPVLHEGYVQLFNKYPDAEVGVLDTDLTKEIDYLRKDIRALSPDVARLAIEGLGRTARLISAVALKDIFSNEKSEIVMPDDDVTHLLLANHQLANDNVSYEPIFLRWDRGNVQVNKDVIADSVIEKEDVNPNVLSLLGSEASKSTNWWRHIGAVLTKDEEIITGSRNQTLPTDYSLYIDSDPRITARRGSSIELSLDIHAESKLIAEMARKGIALEGTELYVTTFPCPNCAKLIAMSGIKKCYFAEGYAMLDGYQVLKDADVKVIKIEVPIDSDSRSLIRPYPES